MTRANDKCFRQPLVHSFSLIFICAAWSVALYYLADLQTPVMWCSYSQ